MAPHKLLTKALRELLPKLYATESVPMAEKVAVARFFTPDSNWTWYAVEFDGNNTFFGYVQGFENEFGYFSLSELQEARGPLGLPIERDLYFEPTPLVELDSSLKAEANSRQEEERGEAPQLSVVNAAPTRRTAMSTTPEKKNAPVHKERSGSVEAAIWENKVDSEGKTRLGITLTKSYKDPSGNWQRTTTLDPNDLPRAVEVLERANAWVVGQRQAIAQVAEPNPLEEYLDQGQQEQREGRTVTRGR